MYELVKLGGQVLNAALEAGRDVFDGSTMADLFREKTFSVDGKTMRTDKDNQVLLDFCVKDFDVDDETWSTVRTVYDIRKILLSHLVRENSW